MPKADNPYDAVLTPSSEGVLQVYGLVAMPVPPVTLNAALLAAAPMAPAYFNSGSGGIVLIANCLAVVAGSFVLKYPGGTVDPPPIVGIALLAYSPPSLLIGVQALDAPLVFESAADLGPGTISCTVAKPAS